MATLPGGLGKLNSAPEVRIPLSRYAISKHDTFLGSLDTRALLSHARINPGTTLLRRDEHLLVLLSNIDLTRDEAHGLGVERLRVGFASTGLRVMLSRPDLGRALASLSSFFAANSPVLRLDIYQSGDAVKLSLTACGRDQAEGALLEEIWLNAIYIFISWYVGRSPPIIGASSRIPTMQGLSHVWRDARIITKVDDHCSIELPAECLSWPRSISDVESPLGEALSFWVGHVGGGGKISAAIGAELYSADVKLADFEAGCVSDRQRSRRVRKAHGMNFRAVRAKALESLAVKLLEQTDDTVDTIAMRLGYAEERSFRRFVSRSTGFTPAQIRQRASERRTLGVPGRIRELASKIDI